MGAGSPTFRLTLVIIIISIPSMSIASLAKPVARRLTLRFVAQPDPISAQRSQNHQGDGRRAQDFRRHQTPEPGALLRSGAPQGKPLTPSLTVGRLREQARFHLLRSRLIGGDVHLHGVLRRGHLGGGVPTGPAGARHQALQQADHHSHQRPPRARHRPPGHQGYWVSHSIQNQNI